MAFLITDTRTGLSRNCLPRKVSQNRELFRNPGSSEVRACIHRSVRAAIRIHTPLALDDRLVGRHRSVRECQPNDEASGAGAIVLNDSTEP
jgi:hypothetical protein